MKSIIYSALETLTAEIKKTFWILGSRAFLLVLLLIFIDFILGGFIFYKYVFLAEKEEPNVTENVIKFNNKDYQDVMEELQAREQSNKELSTANQPNPSEQSQNSLSD